MCKIYNAGEIIYSVRVINIFLPDILYSWILLKDQTQLWKINTSSFQIQMMLGLVLHLKCLLYFFFIIFIKHFQTKKVESS